LPHRIYTEAYGGAASVLLRKPRCYSEVYNDLDGEIVNLFRVLRNPSQARELTRLIRLTPFAREEFELSYIIADDPIEQARRTVFRSFAGFSSAGTTGKWTTGFRNNATHSGSTPAQDWGNYPDALGAIVDRLRGVVIESQPAVDIIRKFDGPDTLHYIDPPYPAETRNDRWGDGAYRYEMTSDEHRTLADTLRNVRGMVVVSGYACPLYDDELYSDWRRVEKETHADGAKKRTEVLWIKPGGSMDTLPLFAGLG
jgi:DNA adenine methylase